MLQKNPAPKALCKSTCNRGKQLEKQQPRENFGRRPEVLQKSPAPKALCRSTCNRGKQLEKQQQMKRKKKKNKKNNKKILRTVEERVDDKCMVCGEKEEDDVDIEDWVACEMCSQWIHSKCIPSNHPYSISHAD